MCGIIGYVGEREAKPLLLQGLKRLEYRGYDSAGIALREDDRLDYVRAVGNLENLVAAAGPNGSTSRHGLGHTRWATHGGVTRDNAHPHLDEDRRFAVVHNGTLSAHHRLRSQLQEQGHTFRSETDTEFRRIVGAFRDGNYNYSALVKEFFSSPLVTNAATTSITNAPYFAAVVRF